MFLSFGGTTNNVFFLALGRLSLAFFTMNTEYICASSGHGYGND